MVVTSSGIASILERCVLAGADRPAYTDLIEGRDVGRVLSYGELYRLAGQGASLLREHLQPGDRVLLLHDDSLDFMVAFLACIFARVIAVPIPPPDATRLKRTLPRVLTVVADCQASAVLANAGVRAQLQQAFAEVTELARLPWLAQEDFAGRVSSPPLAVAPDDVAYLQYSSGSTSMPKGVMMTHGNLLDNLHMLQRGFAYDETSVSLTWMPYFHDYGLVDGLLQPLYSQVPCYVMSPVAMIKRPWRWLEAVSRFRATHTHGPNFSYQMCVDRISDDKLAALDLACLRTAGCGAEPVLQETVDRFIARFARCGFRPTAFAPAYGLAEATLMVTAKPPGSLFRTVFLAPENSDSPRCVDLPADDPQARAIISCGVPPDPFDLCIVDPETGAELPENTTGEIWLANSSVAAGYWQQPQETAACFAARTRGGRGPMLRTGDLGFLRDGELYVTGRIKDLIIINGLNHYPQDIEQTVEAVGAWVRRTFVVAFAIEQAGTERLVVAAELNGRVAEDGGNALLDALRAAISLQHEIACAAILLLPRGSLAKTSSGKIQRAASKAAYLNGEWAPLASWREIPAAQDCATTLSVLADPPVALAVTVLERLIRDLFARHKGLPAESFGVLDHFANLGISSRLAVEIAAELEDLVGRPVAATILWEYPNIRALAACLASGGAAETLAVPMDEATTDEVAIIGMACRFPGAADTDAFWRLLNSGEIAIGAPPGDRFGKVLAGFQGGFIEGVFEFDAGFFGISDGEACRMDPQQRLLLSTAWHALEDAGLTAARLAGSDTGVYLGVSASEHAQRSASEAHRFAVSGNSLAIIANRLSYFLDLRGPSLSIDTACSASLVAVHQACSALRAGDCDLALAGGVSVLLDPVAVDSLQQAEMLSPRGVSLPFAAAADGYVRGEGCGLLVLKPLAAARRDGDRVLAVIRGSAVAQDGRSNGLTAPNGMAQRQVIRKALARAGVAAENVGYIEAHGTGTPLGDPIEWRALAACYGDDGALPCHVGAVKGGIGHLEGAAGIAGLIKSVLVLQHGQIPGAPWMAQINPQLAGDAGRLRLARESTAWPVSAPRLAAVSSFGFGGTLAHLLLAAAPEKLLDAPAELVQSLPQLLLLSAADPAALGRLVAACQPWPASSVPARCAGMARYRSHLPWRAAIVAAPGELAQRLGDWRESHAVAAKAGGEGGVAWFFSAQPISTVGFGGALYRRFAAFRAAVDALNPILESGLGIPVAALLCQPADSLLDDPRRDETRLLVWQLGLIHLWQSWGMSPAVVLGHGIGELAAAVAARVMSAADALRLGMARASRVAFANRLAGLSLQAPCLPVLSPVSGQFLGDELAHADYWLGWFDEPAVPCRALPALLAQPLAIVLEMGAPVASAWASAMASEQPTARWLSLLAAGRAEDEGLLYVAGQLFLAGQPLDWAAVYGEITATRDLPAYPFGRKIYRHPAWAYETVAKASLPATYACVWQQQSPTALPTSHSGGCQPVPKVILYSDVQTGVSQVLGDACLAAAAEIRPWSAFAAGEPGLSSVGDIVLVQCMARPDEPVAAAALRLAEGLLAGLRALRGRPAPGGRVWAITRGAAALPQDATCSPEAACVQGAGRVAALEMPDLWGGLLDLPADLAAVDLAQLLPAIRQAGQEDQMALRQGQRFVARLQPLLLPPAEPVRLSADLAYWVVGGSGALGRQVLAALYAVGARCLLVSGRQPMPAQPFDVPGVIYQQADVADPDQVQQVLTCLDRQGWLLGGIVHAAGNASEYPIEQLNSERFQAVAAAKLAGAWNLHWQTRDRRLQFFVCFASIAGLWGSSGQAHYAAANHFLDMLCEHRRRLGLPGLAIDWGPWAGGGLVDQALEKRLRQTGLDLLSPASALALFGQLLDSNLPRLAAVDVRWPEFLASFTVRRTSPLLSELLLAQTEETPAIRLTGSIAQVAAEIRRCVEQAVSAQLGRQPDVVRGFFDQGLDSLAMVSIHRQLTAALGIRFPRPDLFSHASVVALSERLLVLWQTAMAVAAGECADREGNKDKESTGQAAADALSCEEIAAAIEAEMIALGLPDN